MMKESAKIIIAVASLFTFSILNPAVYAQDLKNLQSFSMQLSSRIPEPYLNHFNWTCSPIRSSYIDQKFAKTFENAVWASKSLTDRSVELQPIHAVELQPFTLNNLYWNCPGPDSFSEAIFIGLGQMLLDLSSKPQNRRTILNGYF